MEATDNNHTTNAQLDEDTTYHAYLVESKQRADDRVQREMATNPTNTPLICQRIKEAAIWYKLLAKQIKKEQKQHKKVGEDYVLYINEGTYPIN